LHSFTGSAGQAIISKTAAYLVTDSRYWLQAQDEIDENWHLIPAGAFDGPKDWIDWLVVCIISTSSSLCADASPFDL
jgi:Xaa-Pro aminopeptidase